jgi:formylglycine-generating enzyme required for sulfatase activity
MGQDNSYAGSNIVIGSSGTINQTIFQEDPRFAVADLDCPYPGLGHYPQDGSFVYAGRSGLVEQVGALLSEAGAQVERLFVIGASGSGKSSFIRAGLLPWLEHHYTDLRYVVRAPAVFTPGANPRARLHEHVLQRWGLEYNPEWALERGLAALVEQTPASWRNIIVIDQFEEIWTQSPPEQRAELIAAILAMPPFSAARTHLIIAMRADFLGELYEHAALYRAATGPHAIALRPMNRAQIEAAITTPLAATYPGKQWEPSLLNDLTAVAADRVDALPLLQMLLTQVWDTGKLWNERALDFDRAISDHAEHIHNDDSYSDDDRRRIMSLLIDLVRVGEEARYDTRQWRSRAALCANDPHRDALITDLVRRRLLSGDSELRDGRSVPVVTIIHESLLTHWTRLREAIQLARDSLRYRNRLSELFNDWLAGGRADTYLLGGAYLSQARQLNQANDIMFRDNSELRTFYEHSEARERSELEQRLKQQQEIIAAKVRELEARERFSAAQARQLKQQEELVAAQGHTLTAQARARRWLTIAVSALVVLLLAASAIGLYFFRQDSARRAAERIEQERYAAALALSPQDGVAGGQVSLGAAKEGEVSFVPLTFALEDFRIDSHEVSNGQYCLCWQNGTCDHPNYEQITVCDPQIADLPVTYVNLPQANDYCAWLGRRLPTEFEWEWVARGEAGRRFPTGDDVPRPGEVNIGPHSGPGQLWPVADQHADRVPGTTVLGMTGNVEEWTLSSAADYREPAYLTTLYSAELPPAEPSRLFVARGGNWFERADTALATFRRPYPSNANNEFLGFRCLEGMDLQELEEVMQR